MANKKRIAPVVFLVITIIAALLLYRPYLRTFEYPLKYSEQVEASAKKYNVDKYLIYSVIKAESKFKKDAQSHKGACGLMQITPETALWIMEQTGIAGDIYSPEINIAIGSWYLAKLIDDFDGDVTAALAAYNAGAANVSKWMKNGRLDKKDIAFGETRDYVYKTLEYYENYIKLYKGGK